VLALVAGVLLGIDRQPDALAAIAADFDAGNIISDSVFFNSSAMTTDQVQSFLNACGGNCVSGEAACLKGYLDVTVAKANDGMCQGYQGGLVQSAAQIIVGAARSCGINPQVLLVLLEKEQGLVTGTKPSNADYRAATGFGCPDTAPCDSQYYGFFNQVYMAARKYQVYAANPQDYRYKAGQVNSILWSPKAGCGAANVFVANQATAGLYNYTPYQPNAAAMQNLYGTGDACSAYGNRNFWRIFTDWFGNPQVGSSILRSPDNPAVYVVSGTSKYLVGDMATVEALYPLGKVGYVSQQYLDRRTTVSAMSRVVLAPSGGVYFLDAGMKLPFNSCAQVAEYGADCASLVRLEQPLIDAFVTGPGITPLYRTTSGKAFYVTGGVKREVADDTSLTEAGLPTSGVRLLESGLAYLGYGAPITRDGIVLQNRGSGAVVASAGGTFTSVSPALRAATALSSWAVRPLDDASMRRLTVSTALGGWAQEAGGSRVYLLTDSGKREVTDPALRPPSVPQMPTALLNVFPDAGTLDADTFIKGTGSGAVYALGAGARRPVQSWSDLVALDGGNANPRIVTVDQQLVNLLAVGPTQLGPGTLVHSPRSLAVYLVDNRSDLVPVGAFAVTDELGAKRVVAVADADIDAYSVRPGALTTAVTCAGTQYLGLGGTLYQVGSDVAAAYNLAYTTTLDPLSCATLTRSPTGLTRFLRADSGAIYYIDAGTKRTIPSYPRYLALGGTSANTIQVSSFALSLIPTGAAM
jgi:hypothetical protein